MLMVIYFSVSAQIAIQMCMVEYSPFREYIHNFFELKQWPHLARATPTAPAAYPFSYMEPQKAEFLEVITLYNAANVSLSNIAPIGKAHDHRIVWIVSVNIIAQLDKYIHISTLNLS